MDWRTFLILGAIDLRRCHSTNGAPCLPALALLLLSLVDTPPLEQRHGERIPAFHPPPLSAYCTRGGRRGVYSNTVAHMSQPCGAGPSGPPQPPPISTSNPSGPRGGKMGVNTRGRWLFGVSSREVSGPHPRMGGWEIPPPPGGRAAPIVCRSSFLPPYAGGGGAAPPWGAGGAWEGGVRPG